jgi:hypothetical protein
MGTVPFGTNPAISLQIQTFDIYIKIGLVDIW